MSLTDTAQVIGVSHGWVCQLRRRFMRGQIAGASDAPSPGGRKRQNMSVEEGREFLAPFFEQSAHQMRVKVAFNLREGYLKADLLQPELILLKVSMPVMDGFATCPVLKYNERTHHISVIFQSAASKVVRCIEGLALDADTMPSTAIACTFVPHTALPLYPRTDLRKWLGHSG